MPLLTVLLLLAGFLLFSCETLQNAREEGALPQEASIAELEELKEAEEAAIAQLEEEIDPNSFEDGSPIATAQDPFPGKDTLLVSFAGDLMAHNVLWKNTDDYDAMYDDVREMLSGCDLSLANMETPVDDKKPYATYPQFNVHRAKAFSGRYRYRTEEEYIFIAITLTVFLWERISQFTKTALNMRVRRLLLRCKARIYPVFCLLKSLKKSVLMLRWRCFRFLQLINIHITIWITTKTEILSV